MKHFLFGISAVVLGFVSVAFLRQSVPATYAATPTWTICCMEATAQSTSTIVVTWRTPASSGETGVTGYKIEREFPVGGGFTTLVVNTNSTAGSYTDTNLAPGTQYNYRVTPLGSDGGVGQASLAQGAARTFDAPLPTPPDRVMGLVASSVTSSSITISWTAPHSDSAITGYKVERESPVGGGYLTLLANFANNTAMSYTDLSVGPGHVYSYRVTAFNGFGAGIPSIPVDVFFGLPYAPERVGVVAANGQATVTWMPPLFVGPGLTGYQITGAPSGTIIITPTSTSKLITGLVNGTSYTFSVIAVNVLGAGAPAVTNAVIPMANTPAAPQLPPVTVSPLPSSNVQSSTPSSAMPSGASSFLKSLTLGVRGTDVVALQIFLIHQMKGAAAAKLSVVGSTGLFGSMTQRALAEYQASVGISPAVGYFGPVTRAYVNARLQ